MALPKYAALKTPNSNKYLEYIHVGSLLGCLKLSADNVVSIYTKFEIEPAAKISSYPDCKLVNIRCCYNNKYWASSNDSTHMVTPFVDKPQEDNYSWPCTLFELWSYSNSTYKLFDPKMQSHIALCNDSKIHENCLTTRYSRRDVYSQKEFLLVDWESLLVLPKYVAFKGNNGKYLSTYWFDDFDYLQFSSDDIGDPKVRHQVFTMSDGSVRIKANNLDRFWIRDPNWIKANSGDTTANNKNTLFWPVKVSKNVIALRCLANNNYLKRLSADDKTNCLNASLESITDEAHLEIHEPLLSREIYNVAFRPLNTRLYGEKVLTMANGDASNGGTESVNVNMELSYTEEKSSAWNSSLSLTLGVETSIQTGIPLIAEGEITISASFTGTYEWGETLTESKEVKTTYTVNVPPKTRMKVALMATMATCDVPFSYTQRDTLVTGEQIITEFDDGVYVGANCYNFTYQNTPIAF